MSERIVEIAKGPAVLIAVPVLNEEESILACLRSLLLQEGAGDMCIVVADGGSSDRTCEIVRSLQTRNANLHLIHNPGRLQSAGVNLVARSPFSGDALIRADAHAIYPAGFVRECLASMRQSGAVSVVVPMRTEGKAPFQRAVAAAQNSMFGNGGAAHRRQGGSRFVDHGHHAAFNRAFFLELGGYDESFRWNEDAEYDARVASAGGRIWLCQEAAIVYFPRRTLGGLARQYRNHGRGRAQTLLAHKITPKARQLAPVGVAGLFTASLILSPIWRPAAGLLVAILATYALFGMVKALEARRISYVGAGLAAAVMHFSWAFGFSAKLASALFDRVTGSRAASPAAPNLRERSSATTGV